MLPVSIAEAKGIYGFKKELGTTEDGFIRRRRDSNATAKLEPLIVRDRERRYQREGSFCICLVLLPEASAISFHDRLVTVSFI